MIVHDCCPANKEHASPQPTQGSWCGVTYCAFVELVLSRRDLIYYTVDTDHGCGVIKKESSEGTRMLKQGAAGELAEQWRNQRNRNADMFEFYCNHKRDLLNLVSVEELPAPLSLRSAQFFRRANGLERPAAGQAENSAAG
jgi:hypothetical protein